MPLNDYSIIYQNHKYLIVNRNNVNYDTILSCEKRIKKYLANECDKDSILRVSYECIDFLKNLSKKYYMYSNLYYDYIDFPDDPDDIDELFDSDSSDEFDETHDSKIEHENFLVTKLWKNFCLLFKNSLPIITYGPYKCFCYMITKLEKNIQDVNQTTSLKQLYNYRYDVFLFREVLLFDIDTELIIK